jgi:CHAT domain-containing protein
MARKRAVFFRKLYSLLTLFPLLPLCPLLSAPQALLAEPIASFFEGEAAQSSAPKQLVQRGREYYQAGQFTEAATVWKQAAEAFAVQSDRLNQAMVLSNLSLAYQQLGQWSGATKATDTSLKLLQSGQATGNRQERSRIFAQALNTQGSLQLALGQSEQALIAWQQAAAGYRQADDDVGITRSLINQAQALRALGLYRRALTTLTEVNEILQKQPDSPIKAAGLRSLGTTLQLVGNADQSRQVLQQSLVLAQKLKSPPDISAALFSLGSTAQTQQDAKAALAFYQQAATASADSTTKVQAQLNKLSLLLDQQQWSAAEALWPQIQSEIAHLPESRNTVYAQINFAQSLMKLGVTPSYIAQLVAKAVKQAKSLGDRRAEAYALGNLAKVYEQTQQWSSAQDLTQQALLLAQAINAPDIAYNWQWQLGRLLKAQGDTQGAIAAYTQTVKTLQSLRSDLVAINPDVQFSFRESVEPVYRELVSLLLQPGPPEPNQKNLAQARDVIESLHLAELDNFFREACLDTKKVQIDQINAQAAVIYPIILADRLEVILSLPGQPLRHYATELSESKVESTINQLRQTLVIRSRRKFMPFSQDLYDWLIRPTEADLAKSGVNTLVFVLDGALRNIPMAALHDGNKYLVEKYSIALAPGLSLVDPKPLQREKLKALTVGLSEARQGFGPLSYVPMELKQIQSEVPTSEVLLDREFTSTAFQEQIESLPFPVVHIASHGKFSSKAEETFILTWDARINVKALDNILQPRNPSRSGVIELLVLSACETAAGDKRAALGLAGIAVRAGARSTVASLWSVNDAATALVMSQFYRELGNTTKAEALRRAQLKLIQDPSYQHPIYWAPYVLVGNWL